MKAQLNNREVEIIEIQQEKDPCDSFILEAVYVDTGEELTRDELDVLTSECADMIYEDWIDHNTSTAYDLYKDSYKYGGE